MVNLRKLVAFDMAHHGAMFIVGEFALGILGPIGLGIFSIFRAGPLISWYLIGIGCNYIPLFLYSIIIARKGSARTEAAYELEHKKPKPKSMAWARS